jgi:hypothetical protein
MDQKMNFVTTSHHTFAHKYGHNFPTGLPCSTAGVPTLASLAFEPLFTIVGSDSHLSKEPGLLPKSPDGEPKHDTAVK